MKPLVVRVIARSLVLATCLTVATTAEPSVDAAEVTTLGGTGTPVAITAIKTVTGDFVAGGHITYVVTIHNDGDVDYLDTPGPEFEDILAPGGLDGEGAEATAGTVEMLTIDQSEVWWNGSIGAGDTVTITIDARILSGAELYYQDGVIPNQGRVNVDTNGDGTHDTIVLTDDVAGGAVEPTIFTFPVTPRVTTSTTAAPNTTGTTAGVTADTLPRTGDTIPRTGWMATGTQASVAFGLILVGGGLALMTTRIRRGTHKSDSG